MFQIVSTYFMTEFAIIILTNLSMSQSYESQSNYDQFHFVPKLFTLKRDTPV